MLYDAEHQCIGMVSLGDEQDSGHRETETEQSHGDSCPPSDIHSSPGKAAELLVKQFPKPLCTQQLFLQLRWPSTRRNHKKKKKRKKDGGAASGSQARISPCSPLCWSTQAQKGKGGEDVPSLFPLHG